MNIPKSLIKKYNVPVPRYTSYPPANFFHSRFTGEDIRKTIINSNADQPENISLYIHIPFCARLCLYCACNTYISHDKTLIRQYIKTLKQEILLVRDLLNSERRVSQVHWGGGTPNYLPANYIQEIMDLLYKHFRFIPQPEIAMECHPAHLTYDYLDKLDTLGFNRLSVGIQDFKEEVLKNVNRALPNLPVEEIVTFLHKRNISVNLDFVYGLPGQTTESFRKTIKKAVNIAPDRLALFSYAHVPWIKPYQKLLEKYVLPDAGLKTALFETAYKILTDNDYVSIGLDHFAKPVDELSLALANKTLSRNFQGYCTRRTTGQVYAFGVSGISQLSTGYLQNTKDLKVYRESIGKGIFPFEKAYFLNKNEKLIRYIITEIMSNRYISFEAIEKRFNRSYDTILDITGLDFDRLKAFEQEGLIEISGKEISVTHQGMFFLRNIASSFDPLIKQTDKQFSKSL